MSRLNTSTRYFSELLDSHKPSFQHTRGRHVVPKEMNFQSKLCTKIKKKIANRKCLAPYACED